MKITDTMVKITGSKMKIMIFDKPFIYSYKTGKRKPKYHKLPSLELADPETSARKSRTALTDIIDANVFQHINIETGKSFQPQFMTFTFKERITDPKEANRLFGLAKKRMDTYLGFTLKYSAVPEYQKELDLNGNPGGRLHFHVLFYNLPFTKDIYQTFLKLWSYGGIYNKSLKKVKSISAYVTKYMYKSFQVKHVKYMKRYFNSEGLFKAKILYRKQESTSLTKYLLDNFECTKKESEYNIAFNNRIRQVEINAPLGTNISDLLDKVPEYQVRKILGVKDD